MDCAAEWKAALASNKNVTSASEAAANLNGGVVDNTRVGRGERECPQTVVQGHDLRLVDGDVRVDDSAVRPFPADAQWLLSESIRGVGGRVRETHGHPWKFHRVTPYDAKVNRASIDQRAEAKASDTPFCPPQLTEFPSPAGGERALVFQIGLAATPLLNAPT